MEYVLVLALGYILGMVTKGVHVTIDRKPTAVPKEYNASTEDLLPDEIRDYMEKNNGYIRT